MAAPNLQLISPVLPVDRRDFPVDKALLDPFGTNPLVDGEWLEIDGNGRLVRGTGDSAKPSYALFAETGRSDTQAIEKMPVLFLGQYHADSLIFDATGLVNGDPLMVSDVTIGSLTKRGLKKAVATACVVGWFERLIGSGATAKCRFVAGMGFSIL